MNTITCKMQGLARPLINRTHMSGFEGPAASTTTDDGYGNAMIRGQVTSAYDCFLTEKTDKAGNIFYDGEVEIPVTESNLYKIAQHVRAGDLRVVDREMERKILKENPRRTKAATATVQAGDAFDVPEGFDGAKAKAYSPAPQRDSDPIIDEASDAEFTEVKISAAQAAAGAVAPKAIEPPKGRDPKATKTKEILSPDLA